MTVKEMREQINAIYEEMGTKHLEDAEGTITDFKGHVQWQMCQRFPGFFPGYCPSSKGMKKVHVEKMFEIVMELYSYYTQPQEAEEVVESVKMDQEQVQENVQENVQKVESYENKQHMLYQETKKGVVNMVQYRNNMKDFKDMNVKVYKIEDISMPGAYFLDFGTTVNIMRKGCNQYGNPKYHLYMESEYMDKIQATKKRFGKVFTDKKNGLRYLSFTSYNIGSDLRLLFKLCGFIED